MDSDLLSEEVNVSNASDLIMDSLDNSIEWPLLRDLAERLEEAGGKSKEIMKVNRWLKEQLSDAQFNPDDSVQGVRRAQFAATLLKLIEDKESMRKRNLEEIVLHKAPLVAEGLTQIKKGSDTDNKENMSFDVLFDVPLYKCETASAEVVESCINDKIMRFSNLFKEFCNSKGVPCDIKPLKNYSDVEVTSYGRIGAEGDVLLNELNVTIQGTTLFDYGVKAQITNVHTLQEACLFPGQMAAITGKCFEDEFAVSYVVSKIRCGIPAEPPMTTSHSNQRFNSENIHISVIRSYLLTEDLQPICFNNVFNKIKRDRPHIVFFMGPFVSVRQVSASGEGLGRIGDISFIYKRFFQEVTMLSEIPQLKQTHFVLVPHCYDVLSGYPLPQPRLNCMTSVLGDITYPDNVLFLPNPGYIRINGILFGVTSCDPVSGIARNMVCIPNENRMQRICEQLIHQRSFFPGYPTSSLPAEYAMDHAMIRHLEFAEDTIPEVFLFSNSNEDEPFVEFAGGRAFVGCRGGGVPSAPEVKDCTDIYISPLVRGKEQIQPLEIESRLSLALAIWHG
ncbi:DNA polymerase 2 alpha 70 kda subunit like protein [Babesia gibsoni]|uniref:DNA polymerase alpha subunit B n=1 Tax=Babesia gibsoni TaxID=33632 RepID=A0AAD8PGE0_BABGI|nr:DNA polymerase 2 alpha 70 kda subunit like protein [Babesia gibsoni]